MKKLKAVWYHLGGSPHGGRVAYLVHGRNIYFTAIQSEHHPRAMSTINAAEDVIIAISIAEARDWQAFSYFDIQTPIGYAGHPKTWWVIHKLTVKNTGGKPQVDAWDEVARGPIPKSAEGIKDEEYIAMNREELALQAQEENKVLPGVATAVLEAFAQYLH